MTGTMTRAMLLMALYVGLIHGAKRGGKGHSSLDTFASQDEHLWFNPAEHADSIQAFIETWGGSQVLECLDMFGASESMAKCWRSQGRHAVSLDYLLGGHDEDILTQRGWYNYLHHLMAVKDRGVVICAPPCSLWVWISRGTHKRCSLGYDICGDTTYLTIRTANSIVRNFGWLLKVLHGVRPHLFWLVEQPTSSQMYDCPDLKPMLEMWQMVMVSTWMGCFGHLLWKGSKLMSNLPGVGQLKKTLTKAEKQKIAKRRQRDARRRQRAGQKEKVFYRIDKKGRVSGGKDLASTAEYPRKFCMAVYNLWVQQYV